MSVDRRADLAARIEASFDAEDWQHDAAAVEDAVGLLDRGVVRVAEPTDAGWVVNGWVR
jgi:2,3,4,5-tetrahydropyridine-2-carboxylate N-succinyltransferase